MHCRKSRFLNQFSRWEEVFMSCTSLIEKVIPNGVKTVSINCFANRASMTKATIPSTVTVIGFQAFDSCESLVEIELPSSVETVNDCKFSGCNKLKKIDTSEFNKNDQKLCILIIPIPD